MANYIFTTPSVKEGPSGGHRLFQFFAIQRALSVGKYNGKYFTTRWANEDDIKLYSEWYIGGHQHTVNDTTKAALIAGGIGVTEANFTAV